MSETIPDPSSANDFDELAAEVATIYDDCSMAASEAYKAAHKNTEWAAAEPEALHPISEQTAESQEYLYLPFKKIAQAGGTEVELGLITDPPAKLGGQTLKKLLLNELSRRRKKELSEPVAQPAVYLIARIDEDCFITLARFAHAHNIGCNYVQIGDEMKDDTVLATPLDEGTPRHKVVEAIRQLLAEPQMATDNTELIENLYTNQLQKAERHIGQAKEALVTRLSTQRVRHGGYQRVHALLSDSSVHNEFVQESTVLNNTYIDGFGAVRLAISRTALPAERSVDEERSKRTSLVAITRYDLVLPLASLDSDTGSIIFEDPELNKQSSEREKAIDALLSCLREEQMFDVETCETPEDYQVATNSDEFGWIVQRHLFERGLLKQSEIHNPYPGIHWREYAIDKGDLQLHPEIQAKIEELCTKIDALINDPREEDRLTVGSAAMQLALSRLPHMQQTKRGVLSLFDVPRLIQQRLGEQTIIEQKLFNAIHTLHDGIPDNELAYSEGVALQRDTGKTRADIALRGIIRRQGTEYAVDVFAKPSAMDDKPFSNKPIRHYVFDTRQSFFDRRTYSPDQVDEKAESLYQLLKLMKKRFTPFED